MAWSYDERNLNTTDALGRLNATRFLIGDTNEDDPIFVCGMCLLKTDSLDAHEDFSMSNAEAAKNRSLEGFDFSEREVAQV